MNRHHVDVHGYMYNKVSVDPLRVMEAHYESHVPTSGWIEARNGTFSVMDEDRGLEFEVKKLTKKEFDYLKSLKETIKLATLARS